MEKIQHNLDNISYADDMRALNYLVETVQGLRAVSGSSAELSVPDADDYDY